MSIYLMVAIAALLVAICALLASALSQAALDLVTFYNRHHHRANRQSRRDAGVLLNHELYRAQRVPTISTEVLSTSSSQQSQSASVFNPVILNHELYRAGAVAKPLAISETAVSVTTQSVNTPKVDPAMWNSQTKAACETTLRNLSGKASNPAGVAVCYNLPGLDNSTGAFQVDLRLYRAAAPAQGWETVFDQTISVALYYPDATVASQETNKRRRDDPAAIWNRTESVEVFELDRRTNDAGPPQILQAFHLLGQINGDMMGEMTNR